MIQPMQTIGLLGGMSWESSIEYYRFINEAVRERLGGHHSAKSLMLSVDFAEIEELQRTGDWETAGARLAAGAESLERGGAELIVLCTNTMHRVADDIQARVSIPLLHIADATGERITRAGLRDVGLLATRYTMEGDFYRRRLEQLHGLRVLVPNEPYRREVHRVIYDELVVGEVREESRRHYRAVMADLVARGAQALVLGCTEIELLVGPGDSDVPVFDTTRIHAEAAVEQALRGTSAAAAVTSAPLALDHCVIAVSDPVRSDAFYSRVLGASVVVLPGGGRAYRFGAQQLNVHSPGVPRSPVARKPVQPGNSDLCFRWPGHIEDALAHLGAHGVQIEVGPDRRPGVGGEGTSVYFRDPDGTLLELIAYNPPLPVNQGG